MAYRLATLAAIIVLVPKAAPAADEITAERSEHGVTVKIGGQPFAEYLVRSGSKPIVWPIIGPTGKPMTRAYPMGSGKHETKDHVHQRSLWFTHGSVNGIDFWGETPAGKVGTIRHREFLKVESGRQAVIVTRNDWLGPTGSKVCEDRRSLAFGADGGSRRIDFDITLRATEGPVRFGDTKEGTFGIRVAETLSVDAKQGGRIINSHGQTDAAAWGKPAAWVDYHGPIDGQTVGIAVLNHPSSFRYPTGWHVRPYGLFAANPFAQLSFRGIETKQTSYTLASGGELTLRYRVLLHLGDEKEGKVGEAFAAYANSTHK